LTDILNLLPTLQKGLNINIHFDSPFKFDDCPALALFRLFEVQMCHAWTVDPQEQETYRVVVKEKGSYDALYSAIIEAQGLNPNESGLSPDQKAEYERKVYEGMSPEHSHQK
jgi:hypothetical protein